MDTDTEARTSQCWKFATPPNGDRQESARTGTAWSEHPCRFVILCLNMISCCVDPAPNHWAHGTRGTHGKHCFRVFRVFRGHFSSGLWLRLRRPGSIRRSNESSGLSSGPPERSRRRILSTGSIRRLARLRLHARCHVFVVTRARFRTAPAGCPGGRWPRLRSSGSGRSGRRSARDRSSAYRPSWPGPARGWHRRRCGS